MHFIGITGGVGAGKSFILHHLREKYQAQILLSDDLAQEMMRAGQPINQRLREILPEDCFLPDGNINRPEMSREIYSAPALLEQVNGVVHPMVKEEIIRRAGEAKQQGERFFFVESALLLENQMDRILDECWYIYTTEDNRRARLKASRGYSDEKITEIFQSQLPESEFRAKCQVVIDNNGTEEASIQQVDAAMERLLRQDLVFGLDIGTRNVVGTVGYLDWDSRFHIIAMESREHQTRAMFDGQIHNIGRVAAVIGEVRAALESRIHGSLDSVCIAAAGRVLKTETASAEYVFPEESFVTEEDLHILDLRAIDEAQQVLNQSKGENYRFYCVGYTVKNRFLNGEPFESLEGHRAQRISEDVIATFLPEDVVDGLYAAVEKAGLRVRSLTLEPIAAMHLAIPENYRMLNIALVDVGAGTSDICITKDGTIAAYGMIPYAGDEMTEALVQKYLADFQMADQMKREASETDRVTFHDIMGIEHTVSSQEIWELTDPVADRVTEAVAKKIKELNGGKTVAACFIVGGGGKVHGFAEKLAEKLGIIPERVALRGEEIMDRIVIEQEGVTKDPLLVTPIGICLNYYNQKNSFLTVTFNERPMRFFNNGALTLMDTALQAGFTRADLLEGHVSPVKFYVNGAPFQINPPEESPAVFLLNGELADGSTRLQNRDDGASIEVRLSRQHPPVLHLSEIQEIQGQNLHFMINGRRVSCPKLIEVNGVLEPPVYTIQNGDVISTREYYTAEQAADLMDLEIPEDAKLLVNGKRATSDTLLYEGAELRITSGIGLDAGSASEMEPEDITDVVDRERNRFDTSDLDALLRDTAGDWAERELEQLHNKDRNAEKNLEKGQRESGTEIEQSAGTMEKRSGEQQEGQSEPTEESPEGAQTTSDSASEDHELTLSEENLRELHRSMPHIVVDADGTMTFYDEDEEQE